MLPLFAGFDFNTPSCYSPCMNIGSIVEYIDQQKIISAVILSEAKGKLRLLNENSREVSFSEKRLAHISDAGLDTGLSKTALVSVITSYSIHYTKLYEVNNAGIAKVQRPDEITEADWDQTIDVNLKSVFLVTQAVLPGMRAAKWGRIISYNFV